MYKFKKVDDNLEGLDSVFEGIERDLRSKPKGYYEIVVRKPKRSELQNSAMHVFFRLIAEQLNESGLYMNSKFLREGFDLEWNERMVKELIWRPVQKALFGHETTKKLTTVQVGKIADLIEKNLAIKGVDVEFPKATKPKYFKF